APESLDSDVLEEQISLQKTLLASAEAQFKSASKLKDPIAKQETQLRAGQSMARLNAKINELEEKLEKLLAFDGASANIFSEIADLKQAVDQGLAMVMSDFKGASSIPTIKGRSLPWVKTINASVAKFSDDGEEELSNIQKKVLKDALSNYVKAGVLSKQEADAIESLPPNKWDMLIDGLNQTKTGVKLGDVLENTFFESIGSLAEGAIEKLTEAGFVPAFIKSSAIALEKASPIVKQWIQQKGLTTLLATSIGSYANDVPTGIGNVVMDGIESMTMEGIKFADDLADDAVGKISGHIVSGPITLGVSAVQAWLSDEVTFGEAVAGNIGGMVTAAGLTGIYYVGGSLLASAGIIASAPVSIGVAGTIALGVAGAEIFNWAYESKILNKYIPINDMTDKVSDSIDNLVDTGKNFF
ncbi:hypothetical protein ACEE65_10570, partial [Streptococcus pluranimalium]